MMGTKTISLTDDAYHRLKKMKRPGESFSDVVQRLTGREDLMRFAGTISDEFAESLMASSREFRRRFDDDARKRGR